MSELNIDQVTREYFPRIQRAALMLTGNPWDADDLAQETFLVVSRQTSRFQGRSSIYTWLYGILLNLDRRRRRNQGTRRRKLQLLWDQQPKDPMTPAAETAIEVAEWKRGIWRWVGELPEGQREALVLRYSEGLRYDEIAEVLDCPLGTVKSRIYHGLMALRRVLENVDDEVRQMPDHPSEDINRAV